MVLLLYHSEGHSKYQQHKSGQLVKNVLLAVLNQTWISQRFLQSTFPLLSAFNHHSSLPEHTEPAASKIIESLWPWGQIDNPFPERSHRTVVFDIFCHYYIIPKPRENRSMNLSIHDWEQYYRPKASCIRITIRTELIPRLTSHLHQVASARRPRAEAANWSSSCENSTEFLN